MCSLTFSGKANGYNCKADNSAVSQNIVFSTDINFMTTNFEIKFTQGHLQNNNTSLNSGKQRQIAITKIL